MYAHKLYVYGDDPSLVEDYKGILQRDHFQVESIPDLQAWMCDWKGSAGDVLVVDLSSMRDLFEEGGKRARMLEGDLTLILVGRLREFARIPKELWSEVDGGILKGNTQKAVSSELKRILEEERDEIKSSKISILKDIYRQGKDRFGAEDIDDLTRLTLNVLKIDFECEYASLSIHREGETGGYDVSYHMGHASPVYPSQQFRDPGIAREGEPAEGMVKGILDGEGLSSLVWSPIPGDELPNGMVLLGKMEGSFSREDLEQLMMITAYMARFIQYVRLRVGRQRERDELFREYKAQMKSERMTSISRLMTSIAHLLNNPLQAIQINLELAMREDVKGQKREHYLGVVKGEVDRLRKVVADMVDHYRPGQRVKTWVSINEVIEDALAMFSPDLEDRNIQVKKDLAEDLPQIWGFPEQLRRVFIHLFSNSIDAMPGGGELSLRTQLQKDHITCMIRDDGKGIPEGYEDKIFDPFFSTKENSHGLGLTICDNIVTQHQGGIELLTSNEEGTSFRITLPTGEQA